jgi:CDP-paratose synthetase
LLLDGLKDSSVKLFINTGTGAEYYNDNILNPSNFYAASKSAARYVIKYYKRVIGFKLIHIIPYSVYGGNSRSKKVIDYIIDSLNSDSPVEMTRGDQVFDFTYIDDVTDFYLHCIKNSELLVDECDYHVGTGKGTTIRELAALVESKTGKKANILWGARPYRPFDIMKVVAPVGGMESLGWMPKISLDQGLDKLLLEGIKNKNV